MVKKFIWEDTPYEYSGNTLEWYLSVGGQKVMEGTSVSFPQETGVTIYVNRLVDDWFEGEAMDVSNGMHAGNMLDVELRDSGDTLLESYRFVYASDGEWDGDDVMLSDPINGHLDPRAKFFMTYYANSATTINIQY